MHAPCAGRRAGRAGRERRSAAGRLSKSRTKGLRGPLSQPFPSFDRQKREEANLLRNDLVDPYVDSGASDLHRRAKALQMAAAGNPIAGFQASAAVTPAWKVDKFQCGHNQLGIIGAKLER